MPALVSGITVTTIAIVGYTGAGMIGAGGLLTMPITLASQDVILILSLFVQFNYRYRFRFQFVVILSRRKLISVNIKNNKGR